MKKKNLAFWKVSTIAIACVSMGFIGASQINPALAQKHDILKASAGDPELRQALKNHLQKRFFKLIDATDAQKEKIDTLVTEQLEYASPIRLEMRQKALELADMIADDSVSDKELLAQIKNVSTMKEKIAQKRQSTIVKLRSILTKDQREIVSLRFKARLTGNPRLGLLQNQ